MDVKSTVLHPAVVVALSVAVAVRVWLLPVVSVIGLTELGLHFLTAQSAPSMEEWRRLHAAVTAEHGPATLVVVAPTWAEPIARVVLGEGLMPVTHLARPGESSFAEALEISLMGGRAPELASWELVHASEVEPFTLKVWRNPHQIRSRFDFVDALQPTTVSVMQRLREATEACPWTESAPRSAGGLGGPPAFPRRRFQCKPHEIVFAGVTIIDDAHYRPRRCVWVHPPPHGSLELTYRGVPLGEWMRGHMGIPWLPARDGLGTPVELEVSIDGQHVAASTYDEREGWKAFEVETHAWAGGPHDVVWRVSSERFEYRHFCFEARAE